MSRFRIVVAVPALIVSLAIPSFALAGPVSDDRAPKTVRSTGSAVAADAAPAPVVPLLAIDASILAATVRIARTAVVAQAPGSSVITRQRPANTRIRKQGAGGTVVMLVSTVAGIAGTVYMLKYMKDQQKDSDAAEGSANRYR
jgi:hypothetical protein